MEGRKLQLIDFSSMPRDRGNIPSVRGSNGLKTFHVDENGIRYICKFHAISNRNDMSYRNSVLSEYLGCHIAEILGLPVQETVLGKDYRPYTQMLQNVVGCKRIDSDSKKLVSCSELLNNKIPVNKNNKQDIYEIINAVKQENIVPNAQFEKFFWRTFMVDAYLGNFDRHSGNWGFLKSINNKYEIAPLYDFGSSVYPQTTDTQKEAALENPYNMKALNDLTFSAMTLKGKYLQYSEFLSNKSSLPKIGKQEWIDVAATIKIKNGEIHSLIDEVPSEYASNLDKDFLHAGFDYRLKSLFLRPIAQRNYATEFDEVYKKVSQSVCQSLMETSRQIKLNNRQKLIDCENQTSISNSKDHNVTHDKTNSDDDISETINITDTSSGMDSRG